MSSNFFSLSTAKVVIADLPNSKGAEVAKAIGGWFAPTDVTSEEQVRHAIGRKKKEKRKKKKERKKERERNDMSTGLGSVSH